MESTETSSSRSSNFLFRGERSAHLGVFLKKGPGHILLFCKSPTAPGNQVPGRQREDVQLPYTGARTAVAKRIAISRRNHQPMPALSCEFSERNIHEERS
jgi:hypothetical protein